MARASCDSLQRVSALTRGGDPVERLLQPADVVQRPAVGQRVAQLQPRIVCDGRSAARAESSSVRRIHVAMPLDLGLGARHSRLAGRADRRTPVTRQLERIDPQRSANHSSAAADGRVLPSSTWLTYSFEKREPPSSPCVSPRAPTQLAHARADPGRARRGALTGAARRSWVLSPMRSTIADAGHLTRPGLRKFAIVSQIPLTKPDQVPVKCQSTIYLISPYLGT